MLRVAGETHELQGEAGAAGDELLFGKNRSLTHQEATMSSVIQVKSNLTSLLITKTKTKMKCRFRKIRFV